MRESRKYGPPLIALSVGGPPPPTALWRGPSSAAASRQVRIAAADWRAGQIWVSLEAPEIGQFCGSHGLKDLSRLFGFSWIPSSRTSDFNVLRGVRPAETFIWSALGNLRNRDVSIDVASTGVTMAEPKRFEPS